jgi:putative Mg2+ transporter-C (MgtC) family protein
LVYKEDRVIDRRLRWGGDLAMISPWELVLRLAVAAVLGALVGLERERLEWAAGMRTHALVSLGSALFMVVSIFGFSDILNERHVILDPSRVAAQVASGIGFIGAGTIIFRREVVKGLTTAASIWAVAAVGLAVGGGMFLAAVSATLLALALLVLAKPLKARMFPNRKEARRVRLVVERGTPLADLREEIEASEVPLERIVVRPGSAEEEDDAELVLGKGSQQEELLSLMDGLRRVSGVREVSSAAANGSAESKPYSPECVERLSEKGPMGSDPLL